MSTDEKKCKHCWHETLIDIGRAGFDTSRIAHSHCCHCNRSRQIRWEKQVPEGHGSYAPLVFTQVSDTEEPERK